MTRGRLLERVGFVLLALLPVLSACHSVKLAPQAREIRVVNVAREVPVPDELQLADARLAATGLAGLIMADVQGEQRADEMNQGMGGSPALLGEIVRSEFESALDASRLFQLGSGESQATFHLEVYHAGLARPYQILPGAGFELEPFIGIQASLQDARKVREAFTVAARVVVAKLIENLRTQMPAR